MTDIDRIVDFLLRVKAGKITLYPNTQVTRADREGHPTYTLDAQEVYAGKVWYDASEAGWKVCVFNDCNELDYLETVTLPSGHVLDYKALDRTILHDWFQAVMTKRDGWRAFGIPGCLDGRCLDCGAELRMGPRDIPGPLHLFCGPSGCVGKRNPPVPTRARKR
jgi:hypothetical protein